MAAPAAEPVAAPVATSDAGWGGAVSDASDDTASGVGQLRRWLAQASASSRSRRTRHAAGSLPPAVPTELAGLVAASMVEQQRLRDKLGPGVWLGTSQTVAQSTDHRVARWKASVCLPARDVVDLCGGLGADAIGFARACDSTKLTVVEDDGFVMAAAAFNLWSAGVDLSRVDFRCQPASASDIDARSMVHIDPDRRPDGRRTISMTHMSPPLDVVAEIIGRCDSGWLKLAPATEFDSSSMSLLRTRPAACRVWLSVGRSVREQGWLWGDTARSLASRFDWSIEHPPENSSTAEPLMDAPPKAACYLRNGQWHLFAPEIFASTPEAETVSPDSLASGWMLDPDPAIRASGLTESFAAAHAARLIGQASGFLASPEQPSDEVRAACVIGRVTHVDRYREKRLKASCREHDVKITQCKVRVDGSRRPAIAPERVCRQFSDTGSRPHTLWIGQWDRHCYAVVTESIVAEDRDPPSVAKAAATT